MNMLSFNTIKRRRSTTRSIVRIIAVIGGIFIASLIVRTVITRTIAYKPLASAPTIINTMLPKRVLVKKINELQTTLESYDAERVTTRAVMDENDALKAELGREPRPIGVLAHVLTLPNRSFYDTFVIDGGEENGIVVGQTVYAFDSIALGTVTGVEATSSTVTLFSAADRTTPGTAVGSDVAVTLIGRGGGEYEVRLPRDVRFEVGGIIAYQVTNTAVLAEIERIVTDPRDPFQRLIAKAPVNLQALKWVIVH
ncbi:MAG: hypothetical protein KBB91_01435 [Candidatus Pacebacteria bacterium]|nr:hypothetical protein [Candidatus Paceibacterota bacterium]MBP9701346.1 hypothetical protein [Candidatus Paceibacterota bacterium]